jgi:tyrosine-protein phosphatase YwqE
LGQWIASGVNLQLDAASLVGAYGRDVQSFALHYAREYQGRVVVASNARDAQTRRTSLAQAREVLLKKNGPRCARLLLSETPALMIEPLKGEPHNDSASADSKTLVSRLRSLRPQKTLLNES